MSVSFRSFTDRHGCGVKAVDLDAQRQIGGSVGAGGANRKRDVRTVQALLNGIGPLEGGPGEMLAVDAIVGPKTLAAIARFQQTHLGFTDQRVDISGKTINLVREPPASPAALGELSGGLGGGSAPARATMQAIKGQKNPLPKLPGNFNKMERYVRRMLTAVSVFPDAKDAVQRAQAQLSRVMPFAQQSSTLPGGGGGQTMLAHLDKHFKTGTKPGAQLLSHLQAINHIYRMMGVIMNQRTSFFGGSPWGEFIYDIDRFPNLNKKAAMYTGMGAIHIAPVKVDRRHNFPIMGSTVYLCDGADTMTTNQWIMGSVHEVAHMAGSLQGGIDDFGYAWEKRYKGLGRFHRMHNAENYAAFAFELKFGTKKLVEITGNEDFLIVPVVTESGTFRT